MNASRKEILKYMTKNVDDHVDRTTLEVNYTLLAEDACSHFNDEEEDGSIDQRYFDLAIEVGMKREKELLEDYEDSGGK
jgi:hypothetical protein